MESHEAHRKVLRLMISSSLAALALACTPNQDSGLTSANDRNLEEKELSEIGEPMRSGDSNQARVAPSPDAQGERRETQPDREPASVQNENERVQSTSGSMAGRSDEGESRPRREPQAVSPEASQIESDLLMEDSAGEREYLEPPAIVEEPQQDEPLEDAPASTEDQEGRSQKELRPGAVTDWQYDKN